MGKPKRPAPPTAAPAPPPGGGSRGKKSFAAELADLLQPGAGPAADDDDIDGAAESDEELRAALESADTSAPPAGGPKRLRMRAALDPTFSAGAYRGRVVGKAEAFGAGDDDGGGGSGEESEGAEADDGSLGGASGEESEEDIAEESEEIGGGDDDAAEEVDEDAVEGKMDDIFGGLDDSGDDAGDGARTFEEFARQQAERRKARRAARAPARKRRRVAADDDRPVGDDDADLSEDADAEFAAQAAAIRAAQSAAQKGLVRDAAADELRAAHSKNQFELWGKLVELRIGVQPALAAAAALPAHYAYPDWAADPAVRERLGGCSAAAAALIAELSRLRTSMLQRNPALRSADAVPVPKAPQLQGAGLKRGALQRLWQLCVASHSQIASAADAELERWHAKTKMVHAGESAANAKLDSATVPILEQISGALRNDERLRRRTQKNRAGKLPFGHPLRAAAPPGEPGGPSEAAVALALQEDPEVFDDNDFYSWLLTDYISHCAQAPQQASAAVQARRAVRDPGRVLIDRKRSKGRKLNTAPNPKLVGFMAPLLQETPASVDSLYRSLFVTA
eukprot:TRINITY_DN8565_c0_g1_i1.p1 TRINITY_DN8565_c0_g1~~TRINITY_DN8565_c0_g1_i1.p1  ORF type:complete len:591 (+),score=212.76 TRINITY_DN8565_c0_g1_i1:75-1775(+)